MRIILHIGTAKTGSSALQVFFSRNRLLLAKQGVLYYESLHRYLPWTKLSNGAVLMYSAYDKLGVLQSPEIKQKLAEDYESIKKNSHLFDTLLFSEETIWQFSLIHDGFWEAMKDALIDVCGNDVRLSIVVSFRRQDEFLYSLWKESARSIQYQLKLQLEEYYESETAQKLLDYNKGIKCIEDILGDGRGNLILRRYDRDLFSENDIFHDFIEATSLTWSDDFSTPGTNVHPSITTDAAEAVVFLKQQKTFDQDTLKALRKATVLYSKLYPEKKAVYPLSYNKRKGLIDRYMADNASLAKKNLGEDSLFSSDIEDYEYRPYDSKRAKKNADILLKLTRLSRKGHALIESTLIR